MLLQKLLLLLLLHELLLLLLQKLLMLLRRPDFLRRKFDPIISVDENRLFRDDGSFLTCRLPTFAAVYNAVNIATTRSSSAATTTSTTATTTASVHHRRRIRNRKRWCGCDTSRMDRGGDGGDDGSSRSCWEWVRVSGDNKSGW